MAIKNLIERFDSSYSVPTNIAITNGNTTDFRSICNSVNEFQEFYDNFSQEIRQEGLITYELESGKTKRCKKVNTSWTWEVIPVSSEIESVAGENGATFTPSITEDGTLSWTNDKSLSNPNPINIKGPKGDTGEQGPQGEPGTTSWNDLLDKPIIPTVEGLATEDYVNQQLGGKALVYLTQAEYDVLSEVDKNDEGKVYNITDGQLSYNDLIDKPDIETLMQKINELTARVEALEAPTRLIN